MTTTTTTDRIEGFVDEVARHFDDLADDERRELLDDLRQHLTELAADDSEALEHELVTPEAYAVELRRSAGLPDLGEASGRTRPWTRLRAEVAARIERLRERPAVQEVREFLPALRPAWWVVRGWVMVVAAAQLVVGGPWWRHVPVPDRSLIGLLLALAAIVVSVRMGREDRDHTPAWRAVDVAAQVVVAVGLVQALTSGMAVQYVEVTHADEPRQPSVLRHPDGEPITNLYLFDEDGQHVEDVFVFDGVGRPVEVGQLDEAGFEEIDTVYPRRSDGTPLTNRYPLEQYVIQYGESGDVAEAGAYGAEREPRTTPEVVLPGSDEAGKRPGSPTEEPTGDPDEPAPAETTSASPEPTAGERPDETGTETQIPGS